MAMIGTWAILGLEKGIKAEGERSSIPAYRHISVHNEWKRLMEAEILQQNRPENVRCVSRVDMEERKLYRDDVVINSWNVSYF